MLQGFEYILIALAAVGAGLVNALAGGGTLITFPALVFLGLPVVEANLTNTVALVPGYFGATIAQKKDLSGQKSRLIWLLPAGAVGGVLGGILLLQTGEKLFGELVPYLILLASGLLAVQDPLRAWLKKRMANHPTQAASEKWAVLPVGFAAIYGGYFGAGLSVIILAVLGLSLEDTLTRLNGLKQAIAFSVNLAAAIFFIFSGRVIWPVALVMAVGALLGGSLGGRLAGRIQAATLRKIVVALGITIAVIYLVR